MTTRFAIDSVTVRDALMFGWGWFLDERAPAARIELGLHYLDGRVRMLRCPQLGTREDLVAAYPYVPHAGGGGFMLQARLPEREELSHFELVVTLEDGGCTRIPLPTLDEACLPQSADAIDAPAVPVTVAPRWSRRAWDLIRDGRWKAFWRLLHARILHAVSAPRTGAPAPATRGERWVVFDHDMGGGANRFRNECLAEWRDGRRQVLLVTPVLSTLEYDVADGGASWRYPTLAACLDALGEVDEVVVNDLPSFDDPLRVLDWALARRDEGARLRYYLNDFHAACPAWTLVGPEGLYCGLPELAQCAGCLPVNKAPFLEMMPDADVGAWRAAWARFLGACDCIVAFSHASVRILHQAHPSLDVARIEVRPHRTDYLGAPPPPYRAVADDVATIGVVGFISEYKGARIVNEMASIIEREHLPARIVVIGSLEGAIPSAALHVTGSYATGELRGLLERHAVDVAFLPSIVHETFSYVTAELMHHAVPLAVFDLGAPAERVGAYPLGRIISQVVARTALDELLAFHYDLAAASGAGSVPSDAP